MSPLWISVVPLLLAAILLAALWLAKRLQFFSHAARSLDQIDIPNEVREIRINELEMLIGNGTDFYFKHAWELTPRQRRAAVAKRLRETRKWLYLVISNAALFQEVARFRIQMAASADPDSVNPEDLHFRIMDRAATVHLIAAVCVLKLLLIEACRTVRPAYEPALVNRFQVLGHALIPGYRHMAKDMLLLAQQYYDKMTYNHLIFQLTGLASVEEAALLNRL
ncbi:MAG TPA: hypothetical protein VI685_10625 [Candidatus Angelobacter sp.]